MLTRPPAWVTLSIFGSCIPQPEYCLAIYSPVCGCDGSTFSNNCQRQAAAMQSAHAGVCR
ncbi:MAG: Kazal-type serine protease inhibitor domain-containing protein [bacterium]